MDTLLEADLAALIGPIVAETLRGFRHDAQADWVAALLRGLQFIELGWDDWRAAAQLGRRLAAAGHDLPTTDLVLAAAAIRRDCSVYTTDPHFDLVPNLRRFVPGD